MEDSDNEEDNQEPYDGSPTAENGSLGGSSTDEGEDESEAEKDVSPPLDFANVKDPLIHGELRHNNRQEEAIAESGSASTENVDEHARKIRSAHLVSLRDGGRVVDSWDYLAQNVSW